MSAGATEVEDVAETVTRVRVHVVHGRSGCQPPSLEVRRLLVVRHGGRLVLDFVRKVKPSLVVKSP